MQLSQIALAEETHDLLFAQRRLFLRDNPYLATLANDYLRNLKDLHAAYGEACEAGLLSLSQFTRWQAVARDLTLLQPGFVAKFRESRGTPAWSCFLAPPASGPAD